MAVKFNNLGVELFASLLPSVASIFSDHKAAGAAVQRLDLSGFIFNDKFGIDFIPNALSNFALRLKTAQDFGDVVQRLLSAKDSVAKFGQSMLKGRAFEMKIGELKHLIYSFRCDLCQFFEKLFIFIPSFWRADNRNSASFGYRPKIKILQRRNHAVLGFKLDSYEVAVDHAEYIRCPAYTNLLDFSNPSPWQSAEMLQDDELKPGFFLQRRIP